MKHYLLSLFSLALIYQSNAQVKYDPLNPDLVLQMPAESGFGNGLKIDVDNDNADDMEFVYTNYASFGIWNVGVSQIDSTQPKVEILYDGSIPKSQIGDYYVKQLAKNDRISSSDSYSNDYPQVGDIYNPNFNGGSGEYLGFRIKSGNGYKYGWMSVELAGSGSMTLTIKELAYQDIVNGSIQAGQTSGVGIEHKDLKSAGFTFYPNPANDFIHVSHTNEVVADQLNVYNLQGKLIKTWSQPALPLKIETTEWNQGMYILQIIDNQNVYNDMFVKN